MKTVASDYLHGTVLVAHGPGEPSDEDWAAYLDLIGKNLPEVQGQIVWSLGGAPTATQRGDARELVSPDGHVPPTAVMTSSIAVRGIVTIFNWFYPKRFKSFSLDNVEGALDYVEVGSWRRNEVELALKALQMVVQ